MLCPKCNNPMHNSSIGLLVCLRCGFTVQPSEPTQFKHEEPPVVATQQATYTEPISEEAPHMLTIDDFSVSENKQKSPLVNLPIINKISGLEAGQKRLLLAGFAMFFIVSITGSFLAFQDYKASSMLKTAANLDQSSMFDEAAAQLSNAKKRIKLPSTNKAINKEIANNVRWKKFYKMQQNAEALIKQGKYIEALDILYQISDDYPSYGAIKNDIAMAGAQTPTDDISVKSDGLSVPVAITTTNPKGVVSFGVSSGRVSINTISGTSGTTSTTSPVPIPVPMPITPLPPPPQPTPVAPKNPIITTTYCQVDASAAMDIYSVAQNIASTCQAKFPSIENLLIASPYAKPHKVIITTYTSVSKNIVYLNSSYLRSNPNDMGFVIRNLAHVAQAYQSGSNWNKEGLADYARFELGYTTSSQYYHCAAGTRLNTNANCGATFLRWARNKYGNALITSLNNQLRNASYSDTDFWPAKTTRTLRENYALCRNTDCKGGDAW